MKNTFLKLFTILLFLFISSCQHKEMEELSSYEDYFIEVTALLDSTKVGEDFRYHITYLETNGLQQLIDVNNSGYGSTIREQPNTFADKIVNGYPAPYSSTSIEPIKEYKKVGVILKPIENIKSFNIIISDIHSGYQIIDVDLDLKDEIKFIYDFDTETYTIE